MAANPIYLPQEMVSVSCCSEKCGITFAMPRRFNEELRRSHEGFYCPRGHCQAYRGKSEEEKIRADLAQKEMKLQSVIESRDRALDESWKRLQKIERLRTRVKQGRCPASRRCKARFENLHEHLKQHHPRHPWRTK